MTGQKPQARRKRGFQRTSSLVQAQVRDAGASRGFAVTRLLTHWAEIAGEDLAAVARPVDVSYGRDGFGATLTILTTGAQAVMLEMQKEKLRERVNACYGYRAISRIRITQTAPSGFSEGRVDFSPATKPAPPNRKINPEQLAHMAKTASGVGDANLKAALEQLGQNILTHQKIEKALK